MERFQRQLKTALATKTDSYNWVDNLPINLPINTKYSKRKLTLHTSRHHFWNLIGIAWSILSGRQKLTIPPNHQRTLSTNWKTIWIDYLLQSLEVRPNNLLYLQIYITEYIFLRNDMVKKPLFTNYSILHKVFERNWKIFYHKKKHTHNTITNDHLKQKNK